MADIKKDFTNRQYNDHMEMGGRLPFNSDGKGILYSGNLNEIRAFHHARHHGLKPIALTEGAAFLTKLDLLKTFGEDRERKIWRAFSRTYAAALTGDIKTFVAGASKRGTFRSVELPVVMNNKKVTTINGIERQKNRSIPPKYF